MSEDAHEIERPWNGYITQAYLDDVRGLIRSDETFRKLYYGEWLPNNDGPIKMSDIKIDKSIPKGHVRLGNIEFDMDRFLSERGPFEPTLQDFLNPPRGHRWKVENETLVMSDEIRNALKELKKKDS